MGKYIRKSKTTGEIAVMEVVSQPSLGVKTRAKTLALKRLAKSSSPSSSTSPAVDGGGGLYLQLRSRRLAKPPILVISRSRKRRKQAVKETCAAQNPNPNNTQNLNSNSRDGSRVGNTGSGSLGMNEKTDAEISEKEIDGESNKDLGFEASFEENVLVVEGRERTTRESTPCSLIRDPETIRTPGSATKPNNSLTGTNRRAQSSSHPHLPTSREMDEFFASAEEEQQKQFIEKYNFDPVNDKPLPGCYEWEKVDH